MVALSGEQLVERPYEGRVFEAGRRVRFGDVNPAGRARLDELLSEYVQDLASDDVDEGALASDLVWVVRRAVFEVRRAPRFLEDLQLATWCSGLGRYWAERRVSMLGDPAGSSMSRPAAVEAALLWVALDRETNRPARIPTAYFDVVGAAAGGRQVSARLGHETARPDGSEVRREPWALHAVDFDLLRHVNNAAAWSMVEQVLGDLDRRQPFRAEIEYRAPVEAGTMLEMVIDQRGPASFSLWAVGSTPAAGAAPTLFTTARVEPLLRD